MSKTLGTMAWYPIHNNIQLTYPKDILLASEPIVWRYVTGQPDRCLQRIGLGASQVCPADVCLSLLGV